LNLKPKTPRREEGPNIRREEFYELSTYSITYSLEEE
jgi:hypothetical protein